MYIFYSGPNDCYASAGVSKRNGADTSVDVIYLGRVLDKEAGIYKSRERGIFTFDPDTGEFGNAPENFVPPKTPDHRKKHKHVSVDFGDAFFVNEYLHASGMMEVVDSIEYGNRDTLHAMILFYMLSGLANCDAVHWYEGSIAVVPQNRVPVSYTKTANYYINSLDLSLRACLIIRRTFFLHFSMLFIIVVCVNIKKRKNSP